jgi:geranylgeranyl diphosphate synthase type II
MDKILSYRSEIADYLNFFLTRHPGRIYEPVRYILDLGGKRIRPALVLAASEALGGTVDDARPLAAAVEVFHNFTLLHDDIMDEADSRRGRPAVHVKWNRDQAILSGDIMFALSYELLMEAQIADLKQAHRLFTTTAKEVCIGQQMDMDFEQRDEVTEEEYLEMIRLKTSVLIGTSCALGAMAAQAADKQIQSFYDFGLNIGLAFQIQDDILDAFGEKAAVGKRIGGDILQNKKTLLFLKALSLSDKATHDRLRYLYSSSVESEMKVQEVKAIMEHVGALAAVSQVQEEFLSKALTSLHKIGLDEQWLQEFSSLAKHQLQRTY